MSELDARSLESIESDGEPMGETGLHVAQILGLLAAFKLLVQRRGDRTVHVGANMNFYFDRADRTRRVCPDVFWAGGIPEPARPRRVYELWVEGKAPDLIVEVASRGTWQEDLGRKKELYQDVFRTAEYLVFDPEESILDEGPLLAWRLARGVYRPARVAPRFRSRVLGASFEVVEGRLRVVDEHGRLVPEELADALRLGGEEGIKQGIQEGIQQGIQEGIQQGVAQGRRDGQERLVRVLRETLLQALEARFGPLPDGVTASVAGLDAPALQRALARVGVTPSPGALLGPE